jgi:hypothetical protein
MMRFNTLLINAVEKCNIRCRHCGYADSKRSLVAAANDLVNWATQAVDYGIRQVNFSGGEVFTRLDLLKAGVEAVRRAGGRSGVFTNGFWGRTEQEALAILEQLPGLTHLHMGCDIYHLEWVPAKNLRNIIRASRQLPEPPLAILNICYATEQDRLRVADLFAEEKDSVIFHFQRVIPSPYVELQVPDACGGGVVLASGDWSDSCYLHTPTIHTTGRVWACHIGTVEVHPQHYDAAATPFFLGDLKQERLREIFVRAEANPVYQMLRVFGPRCVAEASLAGPGGDQVADLRFTSDCDMCYQMMARSEVVAELRRRAGEPRFQQEMALSRFLVLGDIPQGSTA